MLNNIKSIDKNNFFKSIKEFPMQIEEIFEIENIIQNKNNDIIAYDIILFCGMGGSAIGGDLLKSMIQDKLNIPIIINRDYELPNWTTASTLVVLSSYSGNTEEIVSCYDECINRKISPVVISSNGELLKNAKKRGDQYALIPAGLMPRAALGYAIAILFKVFNELAMIKPSDLDKLKDSIVSLKLDAENYSNLDSTSNRAISLAEDIFDAFNIIYTSNRMEVVGMRFRAQLAENSKILASHFVIPEQNHNEIEAFGNIYMKKINVFWIYDISNNKKISKRMKITSSVINDKVKNHNIEFNGNTFIERELRTIYFLDWVSFYCSILNNTNPYPVNSISKLKSLL